MKAQYASGLGPWKGDLPRRDEEAGEAHSLLAEALRAGLVVHPYTLRAEEADPARSRDGVPAVVAEALHLFALGAHGVFIDQPDLGVQARERFLAGTETV